MRPRARLSFAIAAVLIGVMLTGIAIHPARAYIHWRSSTTSLSQISVYTEALLYNSGTTYLAYPPGTGCCPDLQVLSSTDLVNWATLTTVSGALSHGGMMGLTYNPSDQRMYMTWQRTGISETQNTPYGPILLDIPMIVVSSSSDGKTWTKPTNITLDGDQYLPQGGNLVLNGPTIIYDPVNNRLLVEYADYFPSCGCQEVFLNETYGPVFGQTWTPLSTSPVSYASSPLNVAFTPDLKSINGRLYMSYTSYSDKSIHVIQS